MDSNTMQLAVVPEPETAEVEQAHRKRTWLGLPTREEKRHRIHDFIARLKRDLKTSQDLNEELGGMLKDALEKNVDLQEQLTAMTEKLRVAEEANRVNTLGVDFRFAERQIDGPEDQATMPVSQVELLDDGSVRAVAANAATALLDRVVPKAQLAIAASAETKMLPVVTAVKPLIVEDDEEPEVYNETGSGWQVRQPAVMRPVTWGKSTAQELYTDQSTTGTFRVMSLQARGDTGPTSVPGLVRV
jgi:hypothetical protein